MNGDAAPAVAAREPAYMAGFTAIGIIVLAAIAYAIRISIDPGASQNVLTATFLMANVIGWLAGSALRRRAPNSVTGLLLVLLGDAIFPLNLYAPFMLFVPGLRGSVAAGAAGAWKSYKRLGEQELADLEDGIRWLIANAAADPARVGIHGHSYGGFMTAYALTHSDVFSVGIAGSGVYDWRNYDSIYTERYMQTPEHNTDGYDRTSCVAAADKLHGRLLIYHGAMDDNVHLQNAFEFATALQKQGKIFDLMVYPQDRHGIGRGDKHLRELRLDYIEQHLLRRGNGSVATRQPPPAAHHHPPTHTQSPPP